MLGEPVELAPGRLRAAQRLTEGGGEVPQHADVRSLRRLFPGPERLVVPVSGDLSGVLGGRSVGRGVFSGPDYVLDLIRMHPGPGHDPGPGSVRAPVDRDDGELAGGGHAVGGERVAGPAQVSGGVLLGDHDAVIGARGCQRPLDGLLRRHDAAAFLAVAHAAVPSSAVLSIRMSRSSTAGQPWLTGATCPGWPLPQLNAP